MLVCESWRFGAPYLHQTRFVRAHMKNLALWAPWSLMYINPEKIRVWQGMTGYVSSSPYLSAAFGFRMCLCVPGSGHAPALLSSLLPSHEHPTRESYRWIFYSICPQQLRVQIDDQIDKPWYLPFSADILESSSLVWVFISVSLVCLVNSVVLTWLAMHCCWAVRLFLFTEVVMPYEFSYNFPGKLGVLLSNDGMLA